MTTVADLHVQTVRAFLVGDQDERRRLHQQMGPADRDGYSALIAGACIEAIERRFGKDATDAEVVQWVGEIRTRSDKLAQDIDPHTAERLVQTVLGRGSIDDLDDDTVLEYQVALTAAVVGEQDLNEEQVDEFLTKARAIADHLLSA